jgi:hypothetical protein
MVAPAQLSAGFVVEVPSISQYLNPAHRQASPLCSDAPRANDSRTNAARIATLEKRQDELEYLVRTIDLRLKKLENLRA